MKKPLLPAAAALMVLIFFFSGCAGGPPRVNADKRAPAAARTMPAFKSDTELEAYLLEVGRKLKPALSVPGSYVFMDSLETPMAQAAAEPAGAKSESVTNVQHAGVDEGGIVKIHGDHLVILRRGRLFTVAIGDGSLTPVSSVDAFGPEINPHSTWYDEMLVSKDMVVVIGYSYERGGTEVGLFDISSDGRLAYRSTYDLRSNDYYSSRNYASRLIGSKLIFYTPLYLSFYSGASPLQNFPAVRKWRKGATREEFRRIISAADVYRPAQPIDYSYGVALHTVTVCDLAGGGFDCHATSVIGPMGRVFYVSPQAVYVWVTAWNRTGKQPQVQSMVYRMPLAGGSAAPSALRVSASPVDQFSFLESDDGYLNVMVRAGATGDGMWRAEVTQGETAMLRVPVASFSDGSESAPASAYRPLPKPEGYIFQNRFVEDYLLYGTGSGWGRPQNKFRSELYLVPWKGGDIHKLVLNHGADRIEQMGADAVVVGAAGDDLHFTSVRLGGAPAVADDYVRKDASQGELRSHGFFYKPESNDAGILGLPISRPARPGFYHLFENSAAILFLKNDALHFREVGELAAQSERARDDKCRASCVDWYGNARPLFLRGRIIALLGYELVEGDLRNESMQETRRVSFAP